jgi:hypothetical protein
MREKGDKEIVTVYKTTDVHYVVLNDCLMSGISTYTKKQLMDEGEELVADYPEGGPHAMVYGVDRKLVKMTRKEFKNIKGAI